MQPENPAQLGGKIYEMMGMALSGKWSTPVEAYNNPGASFNSTETIEAEVVEPVEASSKKWGHLYDIFLAPHHIAAEAVVYNGSIILGVRLNWLNVV
jgi:hypothetical protein